MPTSLRHPKHLIMTLIAMLTALAAILTVTLITTPPEQANASTLTRRDWQYWQDTSTHRFNTMLFILDNGKYNAVCAQAAKATPDVGAKFTESDKLPARIPRAMGGGGENTMRYIRAAIYYTVGKGAGWLAKDNQYRLTLTHFGISTVIDGERGAGYPNITRTTAYKQLMAKIKAKPMSESYSGIRPIWHQNANGANQSLISWQGSSVAPVSTTLKARKAVNGNKLALKANMFSFSLRSADGKTTLQRVGNDAKGNVTFKALTFRKEGTYKYRIQEDDGRAGGFKYSVSSPIPGMTYNTKPVGVTVTVVDDGSHRFKIRSVTYDNRTPIPTITNTYSKPTATARFTARKTWQANGSTTPVTAFTFQLHEGADGKGRPIGNPIHPDGNGVITTPAITYTMDDLNGGTTRTFDYSLAETDPKLPQVTHDTHPAVYHVKLAWADNRLTATPSTQADTATFTNTYIKPVAYTPTADKHLVGRDIRANEFLFDLLDRDQGNKVIDTTAAGTDGHITFKPITYTTAGVHHYTIREKPGTASGVAYDGRAINLTVTITDQDGILTATPFFDGTGTTPPTFTNTYTPASTTLTPSASKTLKGRALKANEFLFDLVDHDDGDTVIDTAAADRTGHVTFKPITYRQAGIHHYGIREKETGQPNITWDTHEASWTVTVSDDGNGRLAATGVYDTGTTPPVFTNTYTPNPVSISPTMRKDWTAGGSKTPISAFLFDLTDTDTGKVVDTAHPDPDGVIRFHPIAYTTEGVHHYRAAERRGTAGGVTYDPTIHRFDVTITRSMDGVLNAVLTRPDGDTGVFTNTYTPTPAMFTPTASKTLTGGTLRADMFTFELDTEDGTVVSQTSNRADGGVTFPTLTFDRPGTYRYVIRERTGDDRGIAYDTVARRLTVTVSDDGEGRLAATGTYDGKPDPAVFTNHILPCAVTTKSQGRVEFRDGKAELADRAHIACAAAARIEFELWRQGAGDITTDHRIDVTTPVDVDGRTDLTGPTVTVTRPGTYYWRERTVDQHGDVVSYGGPREHGETVDVWTACKVSTRSQGTVTMTNGKAVLHDEASLDCARAATIEYELWRQADHPTGADTLITVTPKHRVSGDTDRGPDVTVTREGTYYWRERTFDRHGNVLSYGRARVSGETVRVTRPLAQTGIIPAVSLLAVIGLLGAAAGVTVIRRRHA